MKYSNYTTKYNFLIALLIFSGCLFPTSKVEDVSEPTVNVVSIEYNEADVKALQPQFQSVSKDDCMKLYIFFSGVKQYIDNSDENLLVRDLFGTPTSMLNEVQGNYKYMRETYPEATKAVNEYLTSGGYTDPQRTVADYKDDLTMRFSTLMEVVKRIYMEK